MAKAYRNEDIYVALLRLLKAKGNKGATNDEMYEAAFNHGYLQRNELDELLTSRFAKDRSDSTNAKKEELDTLFHWAHKRNSVKDDEGTTRYLLSSDGYFQLLQMDELSEAWEDMKFARNDSATARAETESVLQGKGGSLDDEQVASILAAAKAAQKEATEARKKASTSNTLLLLVVLFLLVLLAFMYFGISGNSTTVTSVDDGTVIQVNDTRIDELQAKNTELQAALDAINEKLTALSTTVASHKHAGNKPLKTEDYEILVPIGQ